MKKKLFLLLILVLICSISFAQQSANAYYSAYKSAGFSMVKMDDQHLYAYNGPGILHIDSIGVSAWTKRYLTSGISNGKIKKALNGEVLLMIQHATIGAGNGDVIFFRMDSVGNIRWIRVFGTVNKEIPADFVELPNGNILLLLTASMFTGPDNALVIAAIDSTGSQLWQRSYTSDGGPVTAKAITRTPDGKVFLCGNRTDGSIEVMTDDEGQLKGSWNFPGEYLNDIEYEPFTGDILLCGRRTDPLEPSLSEGFVVRQDTSGQILWQRTVNNDLSHGGSEVICLSYDPYNQHILAGGMLHLRAAQADDDQAMSMVLDTNGTFLSGSLFGSTAAEFIMDISVMNSHSVFWSGFSSSFGPDTSTLIIKTAADGIIDCLGAPLLASFDTLILQADDPGFVQDTGNLDVITLCFPPNELISIAKDLCVAAGISGESTAFQEAQAFPNPNHGSWIIKTGFPAIEGLEVEFYNAQGQQVEYFHYTEQHPGEFNFQAGPEVSPGLYYLILRSLSHTIQFKILIIK